jgi:Protein of Unknown function (DUF2784)
MGMQLAVGAVVVLHLLFIATAVFGALLLVYCPRLLWVQLPVFVWGAAVNLLGWECPLTHWENVLRAHGGLAVYQGSFVGHYLLPAAAREAAGVHTGAAIGVFVLLMNGIGYALLLRKNRRRRPSS